MISNFQLKKVLYPRRQYLPRPSSTSTSLKYPSLLLRGWLPKVESKRFSLQRLHSTTRMFFSNQIYRKNHLKMSTIFSLHTLNQQMKDLSSQSCQSVINNSHVAWAALPQAKAWLYSLCWWSHLQPTTDWQQ